MKLIWTHCKIWAFLIPIWKNCKKLRNSAKKMVCNSGLVRLSIWWSCTNLKKRLSIIFLSILSLKISFAFQKSTSPLNLAHQLTCTFLKNSYTKWKSWNFLRLTIYLSKFINFLRNKANISTLSRALLSNTMLF